MLPFDVKNLRDLHLEKEDSSQDTTQVVDLLLSIAREESSKKITTQVFGVDNPQNPRSKEELANDQVN